MCGIAGAIAIRPEPIPRLAPLLTAMSALIAHRGPDGEGYWTSRDRRIGFAHRRLAVIDLTAAARQPMTGPDGSVITYNGEIYNYLELMEELKPHWPFRSHSDTEAILAAYARWGTDCLRHLRGMFAFALWDGKRFFAARDRFGIKPLYYAVVEDVLYFASEIKALLPILPEIATDPDALAEYLTFQYTVGDRSLFRHVHILLPGHALTVENGGLRIFRYWDDRYELDQHHAPEWFSERLIELLQESVTLHLRSDVPVGAYLSGGLDSSLVAILAARTSAWGRLGFHGKFTDYAGYDESRFADIAARKAGVTLHQTVITAPDFRDTIKDVVYHLDHPVAGPGSFPQYMMSALAAKHVKVVLGGQGGDEVFGGYARYLIAYFEQCLKAAIAGGYNSGSFAVSAESMIPHLSVLREYEPLLRKHLAKGLFGPLDERYLALIDRSSDMTDEIDWSGLDRAGVIDRYHDIFNSSSHARDASQFDSMMHFDFKCLLPALLHVEDRMSMAHGLEARVPLLDSKLFEFAATVPAQIKLKDGQLKHLLKATFANELPAEIADRRDKMGFPVPLNEWFAGPLKDFVHATFASERARARPYVNSRAIFANLEKGERFSRKAWGLLNLEIWQQLFHDRAGDYRRMIDQAEHRRAAAE